MRNFFYLFLIILIVSCSNSQSKTLKKRNVCKSNLREIKAMINCIEYDSLLVRYYKEKDKNPLGTILKIDSLINAYRIEKESPNFIWDCNFESEFYYLKAEILYKLGLYENSLQSLKMSKYRCCKNALAMACNFTKLSMHDSAKAYIDSIGFGYYIYDYALGNYYETIKNKSKALEIYNSIKNDKCCKHYVYYNLAISRIEELEKNNPKLLDEIYFETGNPNFEVCDSDDENRDKVFELLSQIEEVKNDPECNGKWIYEGPYENGKNYYWAKVGKGMVGVNFKTKYDFIIYKETFDIMYYDTIKNDFISLEEWRKHGIK